MLPCMFPELVAVTLYNCVCLLHQYMFIYTGRLTAFSCCKQCICLVLAKLKALLIYLKNCLVDVIYMIHSPQAKYCHA